jgi:hypothetical protein
MCIRPNPLKTILSLCDYSGSWSKPYRDAGYKVIQVDIKHGQDVRLFEFPGQVHGILAAPPCTHLASSGARWASQEIETTCEKSAKRGTYKKTRMNGNE